MFVIGLRTKNIGPIEMKVRKLLAGIIMPIINVGLLPVVFFHLQSIFLQVWQPFVQRHCYKVLEVVRFIIW